MRRTLRSMLPPYVATGRAALQRSLSSTLHTDPATITTLPNQLRVVTGNTPGHFSSVGVYIDAGSRYESSRTSGASHVLDRMAFKSTEARDAVEMSNAVDSLGGQVLCSSSRETMMYQSSHFMSATPLAISLLADAIRRPLFLPEEVDAQRDAAAYEIREINAKPEMVLPEILHQVAYQNNTLGNPLLCPEDRLPYIDRELLKNYVATWFRPDRMVIAGAGIPHYDLVKLVEEHFGDLRTPPKPLNATPPPPSRSIPTHLLSASSPSSSPLFKSLTTAATSFLNPKPIAEPSYEELALAKARYTGGRMFLHRPEEQFNHIYVAFEGVSIHDDDVYALAVIQMLLGGGGSFSAGGPGKGMYSRLYTHVLNHHPAIDHCSSLHHIYADSSLFGIVGTSYPSLRPKDLLPTLVHQLSLLLYNPVSERELQRAKNQLMSSLVMALESRAVEVEDLGRQVLVHGRRVPVTEMCQKIEAVSPANLMRVANRVFGTGAGEPTLLIMGREDIPDWRATMRQYGCLYVDVCCRRGPAATEASFASAVSSMNLGKKQSKAADLSSTLRDADTWSPRPLRRLGISGDVTALAVEPLSGLLVLGTSRGSLHLYGSPAASLELAVPGAPYRSIRFIAFAQLVKKLVVVDSKNSLSIYDLGSIKRPALNGTFQIPQGVNCITTSPSHSHAFLALSDGQCLVYDIDRAQVSPYAIPNAWAVEEARHKTFRPRSEGPNPLLLDVIIHPRDLNSLLLVFDAGIILWDISNRTARRTFNRIVPMGMDSQGRAIASATIYPLGIIFAVGHMDGAISFWSLDHTETPLAVHVLPPHSDSKQAEREPIVKLMWSSFPNLDECKALLSADTSSSKSGIARLVGPTLDYCGGETVLTILGGLLTTDAPGVRMLQFAPITLDSSGNTAASDPETLLVLLSQQLMAIGLERCPSPYPVDDFVLLPRSNPYFNSSHDPIAILQLYKYGGLPLAPAAITASDFPPPLRPVPSFSGLPFTPGSSIRPFPVQLSPEPDAPAQFRLPSANFSGPNAILGACVVRPDQESFSRLIRQWIDVGAAEEADGVSNPRRLPLRAGVARSETESSFSASSSTPYQLLGAHHRDLSVKFYDCSAQLLSSTAALQFEYPQLIPHLTIKVQTIMHDPSLAGIVDPRSPALISGLHLSSDAQHCAVVLMSGHVLFFKFAKNGLPGSDGLSGSLDNMDDAQDIVVVLTDLGQKRRDGFRPICLLDTRCGDVTAVALSDEGLHAVAYADGSIVFFDVDALRVLTGSETSQIAKPKKPANDVVKILKWQTGSRDSDGPLSLFIIRDSGLLQGIELVKDTNNRWTAITPQLWKDSMKTSVIHPKFLFIANERTAGLASPAPLARLSITEGSSASKSLQGRDYLIVCSTDEVRCFSSQSKDRVGKVEWKFSVQHAELIERGGHFALIAFTPERETLVYSIPHLEFCHRLHLEEGPSRLGTISSDSTGDYIEVFTPPLPPEYPFPITLSTLFPSRRPRFPNINFGEPVRPLPPQPGPPANEASYTAWLWGPKVYNGKEIDNILAGPDRPPPKIPPSAIKQQANEPSSSDGGRATQPPLTQTTSSGSGLSASAQDIYSRLANAVSERGEMLSGLEDTFSSLENSSKGMADQAKRIATKNTARRFFF